MPIAASTIAARVISPLRGLSAVARFDRAEAIGGIGLKNAPVNGARTVV